MKRFVYLLPAVIFVAVAGAFWGGLSRDPNDLPSVLIDRPLPEFDLPGVAGDAGGLSTEDLLGEVALLNVFGSWCVSCNIEHPLLMRLAETRAVPIYGLDWKDEPGAGAAWLSARGDPYTAIGDDASGRVAIDLGVTGAPETFVIDRLGRIRHKHVGPITPEIWRGQLAPLIEELRRAETD